MVPRLATALTGPLLDLERTLLAKDTAVERWLRAQWQEHTPPFYCSVDLRTLLPLDEEGVIEAAKQTGRVVVVHEAPRFCGFGGEISAIIAENAIEYMEAPIARVTGFDSPFPNTLEHHYMPDERRVLDAIEHVHAF